MSETGITTRVGERDEARKGVILALAAYGIWGFYGLFFKLVTHIAPLEVVAHRAFWSVPVAGAVLLALGRTSDIRRAFKSPRLIGLLFVTAGLIAISWGFFVWAIAVGRTLETSLGYYMNPLINVMIGYLLLGERFRTAQLVAVGLAVTAVVILTIEAGVVPWLALLLGFSFASYGYLRKTIDVGPAQGFFVEMIILSTVGAIIVVWLSADGELKFAATPRDTILLLLCGPMTAVPLMLFSAAARRLRFSTVGLLQYIAPTGLFLTAVFAFGEPVGLVRIVAFGLIWSGLAVYSIDSVRAEQSRLKRSAGLAGRA